MMSGTGDHVVVIKMFGGNKKKRKKEILGLHNSMPSGQQMLNPAALQYLEDSEEEDEEEEGEDESLGSDGIPRRRNGSTGGRHYPPPTIRVLDENGDGEYIDDSDEEEEELDFGDDAYEGASSLRVSQASSPLRVSQASSPRGSSSITRKTTSYHTSNGPSFNPQVSQQIHSYQRSRGRSPILHRSGMRPEGIGMTEYTSRRVIGGPSTSYRVIGGQHGSSIGGLRSSSPQRRSSAMRRREVPHDDVVYSSEVLGGAGGYRISDHNAAISSKDPKFLRKVQHELESQRGEWQDDVIRMLKGAKLKNITREDGKPLPKNSNSYIDESSGHPIFKSVFDVREFPERCVDISIDKLTNKIVVQAKADDDDSVVSRSFKQKIQLPKFADEKRLRYKYSKNGLLHVEVPLIYHFKPEQKKAKSFINQVKSLQDGSQDLEILVNVGGGYNSWDLHVVIEDEEKLVIYGIHEVITKSGKTKKKRKRIKQYLLPENADTDGITSNLEEGGRLAVHVPLIR